MTNYEIVKFKDGEFELDVNFSPAEDTVWLSRDQIAILFKKDRSVIVKQIKKIYQENLLDKNSTCAKNALVQTEGNRLVKRIIEVFNLDVIISLSHNYKSSRIDHFKTWALSLQNNSIKYEYINNIDNIYQIVKFIDGNIEVNVNFSPSEKTVWLTQKEMANLFETSRNNIGIHLKNIFSNHELEDSVCKEILLTGSDKKKYLVKQYNLDAIIAVGYRVNTNRGILFRRWASSILENYIINGYALNESRLLQNEGCLSLLSSNIESLNKQISKNTKDINKIKKLVFPKQVLIPNDKPYTSKSYVVGLIKDAKESIIIIDPYVDIKTLDILKYRPTEVSLMIITGDKSKLSEIELNDFIFEYGQATFNKTNSFHDRYLIIDEKDCYHLGSSLNYIGSKVSQIDKTDDDILSILLNVIKTLT